MSIKEIKKQLPTGAGREISKISGVGYDSVQRFFRGFETKFDILIMQATTTYLKDYKEQKAKAIKELKEVAEID